MARRTPPGATRRFSVLASGEDVPWRTREEAEAQSAPAGDADPGAAPEAEDAGGGSGADSSA